MNQTLFTINAVGAGQNETGFGKFGQRDQVDVALFLGVVASDKTGQHARVGGGGGVGDEGQTYAGFGVHAKLFQHADVGMATADEDQVFDDGDGVHGGGGWWGGGDGLGPGT